MRAVSARCVLGHVDDPSSRESGPYMARAITQRDATERRAFERSLAARHSHVVSRRHYVRGAGAVSNRKSARVKISTEAPPPKSLEVEPGNEASQDDVLDDVIAHHQWMM